ncbi:MAG: hypothetical protein AB1485_05500 [Candidatus Thermoplasmatota archaeon]
MTSDEWTLVFIFSSGIGILIARLLWDRSALRVYKNIANQYSWRYEENVSSIPHSRATEISPEDADVVTGEVGPAVLGEYNSKKFMLLKHTEDIEGRRGWTHFTLISSPHKGISGEVYISKDGLFAKMFELKDIPLGDSTFDSMFRIECSLDPAKLKDLLDIGIRQKLISLLSRDRWRNFGTLEINQKEVVFVKERKIIDRNFLLAVIDLVTSLANNIDKY